MKIFEFNNNVIDRVVSELDSADDYIRIAVFQIHNQQIFNVLERKLNEGVRVEIFTLPYDSINDDVRDEVTAMFQRIEEKGAILHFCKWNVGDPERTNTAVGRWYSYHGKFIVTDKSAIALSANFTQTEEFDAIIIFENKSDAGAIVNGSSITLFNATLKKSKNITYTIKLPRVRIEFAYQKLITHE